MMNYDEAMESIVTASRFGMNLGLAFQIKDDILDVTGDVEKLGKNTLADVNNQISLLCTD